MANEITTVMVAEYDANLHMLLELRGGIFAGKCLEESIHGEEKYIDQLGSVYATEVTAAFADSPESDLFFDRRKVVATPYDIGNGLDKFETVKTLVDPESKVVVRQVSALRRKSDIEFMKGALGPAATGKAGAGSAVLGAAQLVPVTTGDALGKMNLAKLKYAKRLFLDASVDLDDPSNELYFAWTPQQQDEFMSEETATSADYNSVKTLVNGKIETFYGFKFVLSNSLPWMNAAEDAANLVWSALDVPVTDTSTERACFAWAKSGVTQVTNPDLKSDISLRKDKSNNWYAYSCIRTGAVRTEEPMVVLVPCETV
jgi:hypothetical protein